ncbi:VanR-ABDEGLN family response regulator transcription factor [Oscillibacter sp.]|jgi:two-component system response regulator VanR|uniref:VanR-ABDEGLN family response regulator transcription factor n=1 Tax=Oscillibacter sp. TaxID=1945593 RepID=UPI00216D5E74|nr:VanR-ABDEGLN family response regulator transcription factor [Oscillibacter sp.]MCI9239719.1 VanR-ABDEGLN family response regulator transcription factor [Oscillibacter sp.]
MPHKILVVDDEAEIADLIETYLAEEDYTIFKFYSARDALACIETTDLDLAILDVMLPDIDGFALCRKIRETHTWPIIMLTAKDAETDKITGLTLGADDYVTKPFRPLELAARVKSQLRRYKKYNPARAGDTGPAVPADTLIHGDLVLSKKAHACTLNGRSLDLTPTEFSILRILLENRGTAVGAEELFHQIWKDEYYSKSNNTITVHIRHLREKLGDGTDKPRYIKTVWGVGYKIEANG